MSLAVVCRGVAQTSQRSRERAQEQCSRSQSIRFGRRGRGWQACVAVDDFGGLVFDYVLATNEAGLLRFFLVGFDFTAPTTCMFSFATCLDFLRSFPGVQVFRFFLMG